MQSLYIYVDDSGVLHPNQDYFVYGGYAFLSHLEKEEAERKYKVLVGKIRKDSKMQFELKGSNLRRIHKRALYNVMRKYNSFYVAVKINELQPAILEMPQSRHRFKDYILKRVIKEKIRHYIEQGQLNPYEPLQMFLHIDQQLTSTDGYYDLESSIYEELLMGISNFNYAAHFRPIWFATLKIKIRFCDSSVNYLIQASDIYANRIYTSFKDAQPSLRIKSNITKIHIPKYM